MPSPAPVLHETPLTQRLLLLTLGGDTIHTSWGANCVALAGRDATLLVDPLIAPPHARLVEAALARRGFPPVRHVVLTHHHTDHALGAGHFAARGAAVLCHARCAEAMAAQHGALVAARRRDPALAPLFAEAEPYAPAATFRTSATVELGDVAAVVHHLGPGHTPGDAVVVFESEGFAAVGDLVFDGSHFNYEEADLGALEWRLEQLASLAVGRFVPGHGEWGWREMLEAQATYHREVARLVRAAASAEEARAAVLARFPDHALAFAVESAVLAHRAERG
ncbi:MAG TPA: MBL fold metallo-hydrolase [Anaeromyxobacter sp.]|nr:MBL fold metallo-hydrolase [Anaeromyxobacter sp.]